MEKIIEVKQCRKCGADFDITDRDRDFYKKMEVPDPKMCPLCRMQRLLSFRNERVLYKAKCAYSGQDMLSMYPPDTKAKVYDQKIWWSDKWDPMDYGRDFNFNKSFSEQFNDLRIDTPRINLDNTNNENSEYCNDCDDLKNCYLNFNVSHGEDMYYCSTGGYARDCMDSFWIIQCELCYECTKTFESYHCFWCFNCYSSSDCYFCKNLFGCKNCFGCIGLHQKEYHIFNKPVKKEEFEKLMSEFKFTHENIEKTKEELKKLDQKLPHKNLEIIQSEDCIGDYITNSKNCTYCFDVMESRDCKYIWDGIINDSYDCLNCGSLPATDLMYQCVGAYNTTNIKFCFRCEFSSELSYCEYCSNCKNCFGCVGLRHKNYCIFNKQYSCEEYKKLLAKIIDHMNKTRLPDGQAGEYGEYMSSEIGFIGYNDSLAQYRLPLTKEEALKQGFKWNDYKNPNPEIDSVEGKILPENIEEITDEILNKRIKCEQDGKYFRIIPQELKFYRKHGLALPHLCQDCRHYARMAQMNPRVLCDRKCSNCGMNIKTTYSPERPETVYCEKCYLESIN
ncbi:MAG: hypothetical protein WC806_01170 [Candidatus Gracilibacteria bacterium]|jgi:hypothetical protein